MRNEAERSRSIQIGLRKALADNQFEVFYQTIHSGQGGVVTAIEALVRWHHPERGLLVPKDFLDELRRMGLMGSLTRLVLSRALPQFAAWRAAGLVRGTLHINVGDEFFRDPAAQEELTDVLRSQQLDGSSLVLEITEDVAIGQKQVTATIDAMSGLGIKFAVDDWGAGKVSLLELTHPGISIVKIDRELINRAFNEDAGVLAALLELPRSIGKTVVAEGIETEEMAVLMKAAGVDQVQGHFFGLPRSAAETTVDLARSAAGMSEVA